MIDDPDATAAMLKRLRSANGQLAGVIRMIAQGRNCRAVVTQTAAVSKALSRAGFEIIATAMRESSPGAPQAGATAMTETELEELFFGLA